MKKSLWLLALFVTSTTFAYTTTGDGKTKTEACAKAKNMANSSKECDCSKRDENDPLYNIYPWVCSVDGK